MITWYVVANAARARIWQQSGAQTPWTEVQDAVHPASRQKGTELASDRPGHVEGTGHGLGSASYQPRTDPRQHEHEVFARELALALDAAVRDGRCQQAVLVASNPFLGELFGQLGHAAAKAVQRTVPADYTALDARALQERLAGPG